MFKRNWASSKTAKFKPLLSSALYLEFYFTTFSEKKYFQEKQQRQNWPLHWGAEKPTEYTIAGLHFPAFHIWKVVVCLRSKWSQQLVEEVTQKCKRKLAAFSFSHFQQQPQKKAICKRNIWHLFRDVRATSSFFHDSFIKCMLKCEKLI